MEVFYLIQLGGKDTSATNCLDLFFSDSGEKPSLDDHGLLRQASFSKNFEVSCSADVDYWSLLCVLFVFDTSLFRDEGPKLVQVNSWAVLIGVVGVDVEVPHTNFTEVSGMVFVEINAVVMLTTSVTATSRMLPVLANTAMTVGDVST